MNGGRDTAEAASLFYYLNRSGFNGLCHFNQSGAFNVPFGQYNTVAYHADVPGASRGVRELDVHDHGLRKPAARGR